MTPDFQLIAENIQDGLYLLDPDRRITYWNPAAERITGYRSEEVLGKRCSDNILVHVDELGRNLCKGSCPAAATMADGDTRQAKVYLKHKRGHRVPVHVRTSPLRDKDGRIQGGIELFSEAGNLGNAEKRLKELEKLALIDDLTGLPNRRYLDSQLDAHLNMFHREEISFGLLFLDIDHFKTFNDTYGHQVGDQVLNNLSRTMASAVRSFDLIGRWGGEEFLGLFPHTDREELLVIGDRLLGIIRSVQIPYQEKALQVTVTAGGAVVRKSDTTESILRRADRRLYCGKQAGRDCLILQDPSS
jgi:diguanylate cyclase (GGDEF)-like protein/PAS domain S-box-containing protein